jgi:hypothetical protein
MKHKTHWGPQAQNEQCHHRQGTVPMDATTQTAVGGEPLHQFTPSPDVHV